MSEQEYCVTLYQGAILLTDPGINCYLCFRKLEKKNMNMMMREWAAVRDDAKLGSEMKVNKALQPQHKMCIKLI